MSQADVDGIAGLGILFAFALLMLGSWIGLVIRERVWLRRARKAGRRRCMNVQPDAIAPGVCTRRVGHRGRHAMVVMSNPRPGLDWREHWKRTW